MGYMQDALKDTMMWQKKKILYSRLPHSVASVVPF